MYHHVNNKSGDVIRGWGVSLCGRGRHQMTSNDIKWHQGYITGHQMTSHDIIWYEMSSLETKWYHLMLDHIWWKKWTSNGNSFATLNVTNRWMVRSLTITSLAVHMPIQKTYVHFHPPPRGGYYTLFSFLNEVYNSASYMGGIWFFSDLFQLC